MRVVFISNYYNHHQKMISKYFDKFTGHKYTFLATSEMREDRKILGYGEKSIPPFVIDARCQSIEKNQQLINQTDVIVLGSAASIIIDNLKIKGKLVFKYSERILKKKVSLIKYILIWVKLKWKSNNSNNNYLLCAGAYAANDYVKFGLYKNCMYKWGYFPETIRYNNFDKILKEKKKNQLLWCGRLIDWKHPEYVISVAKLLKDEDIDFNLKIIGSGELEDYLFQMIKEYNLEDCVSLLGSMKPEQVRKHMEESGIYILTSNRQEGWGAVLNEAMNSGCAVVSSNLVGAATYLIEDGKNGYLYEDGSLKDLYNNIKELLNDYEKQNQLGEKAYQTIINEWNAEIAAERFINLVQHILEGEMTPNLYETGPCSKAEIMEDW